MIFHQTSGPPFFNSLMTPTISLARVRSLVHQRRNKPSASRIDYDSKKIIFHSHQREHMPASGEPLSECVTLELQVQGHSVRLIVDTGFPGLLLYEERLLKRVPTLRIAGKPTGVSLGV